MLEDEKKEKEYGIIVFAESDIMLMSAPIFMIFAIKRRKTIGKTTFFEYFFFMIAANPLPFSRPNLADISWTTSIRGRVNNTVHNKPNPNFAPAWEKVPMLAGSSSDAPVIKPGPRNFKNDLKDDNDYSITWLI